jgi:hypothetical protein
VRKRFLGDQKEVSDLITFLELWRTTNQTVLQLLQTDQKQQALDIIRN